jgi:2-oxoisovalerate ferredoxin oxidoreductase alpha subunit
MTSSSGPGISLMQEGFTFLAGAELPAVIVDIMRAGPGLGNIGPEQGDYNQVVKGGGHGNYKNIVLAPNSVQEMCDLTMKAFELADKWRNPVVVLADGTLGQMAEPLVFPEKAIEPKNDKPWAVKGNKETMDNLITSIYNDFNELEDFNYKLQEKYAQIEAEEVIYEEYQVEDADIVLVSFGISSRIARSAVDKSREKGIKVGLLRPITLSPFPVDKVKELADKGVSFISVEMSNGQLLADVQFAALRKEDTHLVNRMGGNLIELKQILAKIYEIAGIEDEDIDLTERSDEKASPNIID